ncbi:DUF1232 domain-containing protein [Chloroflexota bacterium]|nr:DUF1232 domain-containing protein [Chloroflexota bacterium]
MDKEITPLDKVKEGPSGFVKAISEPLSKHGWPAWLVYVLAVIGVVYLLNPTAGLLELIPDVIPGIGNLDESLAVMLIIAGIVEATEGKKYRAEKKNVAKSETPTEND